jgi:hypothetical protein
LRKYDKINDIHAQDCTLNPALGGQGVAPLVLRVYKHVPRVLKTNIKILFLEFFES